MIDGFPTATANGVNVTWAPLVVEPVPGGPERFVAAIAAVSETGETACRRLVDRRRLRTVFGSASPSLSATADTAVASLGRYLEVNGPTQAGQGVPDLCSWRSPLQGVYLGESRAAYVARFSDVFLRAEQFCLANVPAFDSGNESDAQPPISVRGVVKVVKERSPQLANSLDAEVVLHTTEHAIRFTFYGARLAANVVVLNASRMTTSLREARAHLWSLSLVADATGLLFKPSHLELLTGVTEDSAQTRSALDELAFEGQRRSVNVSRVASSEDAAMRIIAQAA